MKVEQPRNVFGKIVVVGLLSYLLVEYNYDVSKYLMSRWDVWWDARGVIFSDMERAGDEAGILGSLILLILYIVLGLVSALLLLVVAGAVWFCGKLNQIYVLPFILAVLVVYSKFSFSFIVEPFVRLVFKILSILTGFIRFVGKTLQLFLLVPLSEVVSARYRPAYRAYRAVTSLLYMIGCISLLIGIGGVAMMMIGERNMPRTIEAAIAKPIEATKQAPSFTQEQHEIEVSAKHPYWTETSILIGKGDEVSISATGEVLIRYPRNRRGEFRRTINGPAGLENYVGAGSYMVPTRFTRDFYSRGYRPESFILKDKPLNGLIGKIGTAKPFYIGKFYEWRATYNGAILLGINQVWLKNGWEGNDGSFQVSITVKRNKR